MTTSPRPRQLTPDDLDRSLEFWEEGPLRKILELEFDIVLDEELQRRGAAAGAEMCRLLHDAVVPEAFLFLTKNIPWTPAEERCLALSLVHQHTIHRELRRRLSVQIDRLGTSLASAKRGIDASSADRGSFFLALLPQER